MHRKGVQANRLIICIVSQHTESNIFLSSSIRKYTEMPCFDCQLIYLFVGSQQDSDRTLEIKILANNDKSWCVKREGRRNFKRKGVETSLEKVVSLLIAQFGQLHCLGPGGSLEICKTS